MESSARHVNLTRRRLLRLLLQRMEDNNRVSSAQMIEDPHRRAFTPDAQFVNAGCNNRHGSAERHSKSEALLEISECLTDLTAD